MDRPLTPRECRHVSGRRLAYLSSIALVTLVALAKVTAPLCAATTTDTKRVVCAAAGDQVTPRMISDGAGGVLLVWVDGRSGNRHLYAQHLLASLDRDPAWPAADVALCVTPGPQSNPRLVSDGAGGAIVAWEDSSSGNWDVYVQHLLATGVVDPAWPAGGLAVGTTALDDRCPTLDSDGGSGAIVAWQSGYVDVLLDEYPDSHVQHVLGSGAVDPTWPSGGALLADAGIPYVVADGAGGAIILSQSQAPDAARHVPATGIEDPTWRPLDYGLPLYGGSIAAASDGAGGAYVLMTLDGTAFRHPLADGTLGPLSYGSHWYRNSAPQEPVMVRDGAGGALSAFSVTLPDPLTAMQQQGIYTVILHPSGEAHEWQLPRQEFPLPSLVLTEEPCVTPDAAGGMLVAWRDERSGALPDIYLQHVLWGGADPSCPAQGRSVSAWTGQPARSPQIAADGAGGAIIAWQGRGPDGTWDLYAVHVPGDAPTAVLVSLLAADATAERARLEWRCEGHAGLPVTFYRCTEPGPWERIGSEIVGGDGQISLVDEAIQPGARYGYRLGFAGAGGESYAGETWLTIPTRFELALRGLQPNPASAAASVAFTLPDDRPASLDLLDATGRRVLTESLGAPGPGRHVVRLPAARSLPAGLYFLRLHHGESVLTARAVIMR